MTSVSADRSPSWRPSPNASRRLRWSRRRRPRHPRPRRQRVAASRRIREGLPRRSRPPVPHRALGASGALGTCHQQVVECADLGSSADSTNPASCRRRDLHAGRWPGTILCVSPGRASIRSKAVRAWPATWGSTRIGLTTRPSTSDSSAQTRCAGRCGSSWSNSRRSSPRRRSACPGTFQAAGGPGSTRCRPPRNCPMWRRRDRLDDLLSVEPT